MFDVIGTVLSALYDFTGDYGLSIMLLTLAIMVVLTPLTLKGTRSMIAMQRLQPEIKKLQNRYKDDRQKLNEEMMKFYKENSINPVGGCLPLLLQMPVFFVLYRVLYGLTNPAPYAQDMGKAFGYAASDKGAYPNFGAFRPNHLDSSSKMFKDLSSVREMKSFGLDLADTAANAFSQSLSKALPYLILIVIIGVTAWYQQKQIQGRNPQMSQQVNPQQQMLMKIMPYFLPLISFTLPAGVILYFVVSNVYRIGQQAFITRTMYHDPHGNLIITHAADTSSTGADEERPKGLFAQLKEAVGDSAPRLGKDARGRPASGKAGGAKGGTARSKGTAKRASTNQAKASRARAGASGKAPTSAAKAGGARSGGSKDGSSKSALAKAGTGTPSGTEGGSVPPGSRSSSAKRRRSGPAATGAPSDSNGSGGNGSTGRTSAEAAREASRPSRQAPAPNPNRSRTKKKRK